jgi:riboflavin kinase/FMN adenylyltransferase
LCSTRHKELILERLGVGHLLELEFDAALAALPAEDFVQRLRRSARPLGSISVGREWAFGRGREGNVGTLKLLGQRDGFAVHGAEPVCVDSEPVSSTRIRHAVEAGDFRLCERLLGREYSVLGRVTEGRRLGRKLGIPTANLTELAEQLPPVGVYAVHVSWNGSLHGGVANLGYRPTVEDTASVRTLEAHVFDFDGDLYGREMEVRFVQRLRDEMKLPDLAALQAQIQRDCAAARNILEMQLAAADVEDAE